MPLRKPGKSLVNWILLGFLLLGLGGFGVQSFISQSDGVIGQVGGVDITGDDYARGVDSEIRNYQAQTQQPLTMEQARGLGIPQTVQNRLLTAAALEAEANDIGLSVGDAAVAEQIRSAPAFQGPTGFDRAQYDQVLRSQGWSERRYEHQVRMDEARIMLQRAAAGATAAPAGAVTAAAAWLTERRDLSWSEITPADLREPVAAPNDATLQAWHQANAARFTTPETRHISYAWLTPEMIEGSVQLDEAALRQAYEERRDEFQQPARRMVDRLVYPDEAAAADAKARLDAGSVSFDELVAERGLQRSAIDLGEVTEAQLGPAGAPVFAAADNGVVGPVQSELGPALFSVNAILDPVNISFEDAQPDLRVEAALDRARREIEDETARVNDLLAGGATVADLPKDTPMQAGTIDWRVDLTPEAGSIAGYPEFRTLAQDLTAGAFPEVLPLGDGGIFAATLDRVTPPALIPFDEARERVLADWTAAETRKRLLELADQRRLAAIEAHSQPEGTKATDLGRDGVIDGLPFEVVARAFDIPAAGDSAVVEAEGRVFVVTVDAVRAQNPADPQVAQVTTAVQQQIAQSLSQDYFDYFADALIAGQRATLNQSAITAIESRMR